MKISYICKWDKKKENTWSGTTYSLYKALEKEVDIKDYDVNLNGLEKIFNFPEKLINKIRNITLSNWHEINVTQKKVDKICENDTDNIFIEIGDLGIPNCEFYVYQDLSIDSLIYYKNNKPEAFKYSGFRFNNKNIGKRKNYQLDVYRKSKGIFTMSKWLADNLVNYTGIPKNKVHYVGGGANVDPSNIKNINKTNSKILFVGRDFFRKGGDITYEAFKILKSKYNKEAELYVAGPKKWPMNDMCEGVTFLGDLSYDELSYYFNICDIFCLPSRFEAYGIVFVEALIYGLPCIGKNDFAMKEFIEDGVNGYLISDENISNLALKMHQLLENNIIKENVLKDRERYIKEYSWETVAKRIISIINEEEVNHE